MPLIRCYFFYLKIIGKIGKKRFTYNGFVVIITNVSEKILNWRLNEMKMTLPKNKIIKFHITFDLSEWNRLV